LTEHLKELDRQVKEFEKEIIAWHRSSELSRKLEKIPGIGPPGVTGICLARQCGMMSSVAIRSPGGE
jgi:hypothetical protein